MCVYIYIYIYTHAYIYIYIYIKRERERIVLYIYLYAHIYVIALKVLDTRSGTSPPIQLSVALHSRRRDLRSRLGVEVCPWLTRQCLCYVIVCYSTSYHSILYHSILHVYYNWVLHVTNQSLAHCLRVQDGASQSPGIVPRSLIICIYIYICIEREIDR